ncbi:MAG TPA: hypothetical protein VH328_07705 [Burkholderiaceae bacterium]|nr:hypothetical protein [Burkholderiaceae bacterium]
MRVLRHALPLLLVAWGAGCGTGTSSAPGVAAAATSMAPSDAAIPSGGAAPASAVSASASGADTLASVNVRLDRMLASAAHCSTDTECRSVAVGGKACGGPTGYRAYSTHLADPAAVEALAKQGSDLALKAERDAHLVSNCLFMADPGAHCEKQRCETGTMGAPGPGSPATR